MKDNSPLGPDGPSCSSPNLPEPSTADQQFEETTIKSVSREESGGWSFSRADGWSFWAPADCPVEPAPGMLARFYGKGIGYPVRGLMLDGKVVYYRTEAGERQHSLEQQYGKDCADYLRKWDEGGVWSIEMGGLGPGYEQAIQITMIEMLRRLVAKAGQVDESTWDAIRADMTEHVGPIVEPLGLSGAQWGAALSLATSLYRHGPIKTLSEADSDRKIQVRSNFPSLAKAEPPSSYEGGAQAEGVA